MTTGIEWTDETWNPVTGCTKVSPGCDHCYAERITNRFGGPGAFDTVVLHPDRLDMPLRWKKPRRVFVNSMSDLFHADVPRDFVVQVFAVMGLSPRHTFQVLTKRPGRMASLLSDPQFGRQVYLVASQIVGYRGDTEQDNRAIVENVLDDEMETMRDFLPNVWLGTSVEDQKWADVRIPKLLETPAAVRFLSCEPLLGPLDIRWGGNPWRQWFPAPGPPDPPGRPPKYIDWVIVGGESGPGARPMHPDWARSLRDQCVGSGVPFFFKQWGEYRPTRVEDDPDFAGGRAFDHPNGGRYSATLRERSTRPFQSGAVRRLVAGDERRDGIIGLDDDTVAVRVGKKRAGRELDGRTWDEMPPSREVVMSKQT